MEIKDRNGTVIQKGDWITYRLEDGSEFGSLPVVSENGVLGLAWEYIGGEAEFVELATTDLAHCEVIRHG